MAFVALVAVSAVVACSASVALVAVEAFPVRAPTKVVACKVPGNVVIGIGFPFASNVADESYEYGTPLRASSEGAVQPTPPIACMLFKD